MKKVLIGAILITLLTSFANAALNEGDSEFRLGGVYLQQNLSTESGTKDAFGVSVGWGHFISDNWQIGIEFLGAWENKVDLYGGDVDLKWYACPRDDWTLYAGGLIGYGYAENADNTDGIYYGPLIGMRWINDTGADLYLQYQYLFFDGGDLDNFFDESNTFILGLAWDY